MDRRRQPGETVALRDLWRDRIWFCVPVVVVEDSSERGMFFRAAGSPCRTPVSRSDGRPLRLPSEPWDLESTESEGRDALSFAWPVIGSSVLLVWDAEREGAFAGWYVNLQSPLRRSLHGFDYTDHVLDIVVEPDRTWSWKDEDELEEAVELGLFTPDEAHAIHDEAERAIQRLERREEPFDDRWLEWRPDPAWPAPELAPGWGLP
jgi:hypothetical protein